MNSWCDYKFGIHPRLIDYTTRGVINCTSDWIETIYPMEFYINLFGFGIQSKFPTDDLHLIHQISTLLA